MSSFLDQTKALARYRGFGVYGNVNSPEARAGEPTFYVVSLRGNWKPFGDELFSPDFAFKEKVSGLPNITSWSDAQIAAIIRGQQKQEEEEAKALQQKYDEITKALEDFRAQRPGPYCLDQAIANFNPVFPTTSDQSAKLRQKITETLCLHRFVVPDEFLSRDASLFNINWLEDAISHVIEGNNYAYLTDRSNGEYIVAVSDQRIAIALKLAGWKLPHWLSQRLFK